MKVYLDVNVLIGGSSRPEHSVLKKLSREDEILLITSYQNILEQHGKVFPAYHNKNKALLDLNKSRFTPLYPEKHAEATRAIKTYEEAREKEKIEKQYWLDSKIHHPTSNFDTIISFGVVGMKFDLKDELNLCEELLVKFKIKGKDAFQIMSAHSSNSDYFLTWDKSLINKCKLVPWLKIKVVTPKTFLESVDNKRA